MTLDVRDHSQVGFSLKKKPILVNQDEYSAKTKNIELDQC